MRGSAEHQPVCALLMRCAAPTRALVAPALAAAVVALSGCGGETAVACDDAGFRAQDEELYVAIATAQNAEANPTATPAGTVADLRRGIETLGAYLDRYPPCEASLRELESRERDALVLLEEAAELLEAGEDVGDRIGRAVEALGAVEQQLFSPS